MTLSAANLFQDDWEAMFIEMDNDKNGMVDQMEFATSMMSSGYIREPEHLKTEFRKIDKTGDGMISKQEFFDYMEKESTVYEHEEAFGIRLFKQYDKDGDGKLEHSEIMLMLKDLGSKVPDAKVKVLTDAMTEKFTDESGNVDLAAFMKEFAKAQ